LKRILFFAAIFILVAIDQTIKLIIARFFIDVEFTIIPNVFYFSPSQNTYRGWIPSMLGFVMPVLMAVTLSIAAMLMVTMFFRYWGFVTYNWGKYKSVLHISSALALSSAICKLIDDIFWGGSLDYILLFDWFVFDLKDVYITFFIVLILFHNIAFNVQHIYKLPKEERKEEERKLRFTYWVKLGLPRKPEY